ncbi:sister chromatid cohesion 1 protein 3-like isoform X5 [Magnolia sinica]|uniref:sister chromatid cohesion 1 protein 3-like isoform X5 n=1 Tax=Magnolia sinica TaxID=86752 RepID=UPI00265AD82D|nr:sister chromatid cohesion 1 protein 3-like isoform X5 [Magnolia sinica]
MFYSHTFLARKGPLGTVWIAAHLQNKLQKSQVAVTDISASADYIMFPEVPIALRLSGHLLLGVVRIYSKKVDYLYHDCNMVLIQIRSAFASEQVNLPEDARHALFHSITLPKTFELDALDLDDAILQAEAPDNHLKAREDITITDQVMGEENPYVAFFINEGSMVDPYQTELHNVVAEPMDEEFMKKQLKHASKLKRKRESLPVTKLDIWKSDKSLQMEQIFFEPSVSGMCTNLQEVFKKDFLASKADSTSTKAHLEPRDAQSPTGMPTFEMENEHPPMNAESPAGIPVFEMEIELPPRDAHSPVGLPECEVEIEHPRFKEVHVDGGLPEFMPSPSRREEFTPFLASNFGSMSQTGKTLETEALHTPEMPFAQSDGLELETPVAGFEELLSAGDTNLPEIPNVLNSAEAEGLCFLEADTTEAGNEENEVGMLPTMTRAVAQYLKKKFFTSNFKRPIRSSQLE